MNFNRNSILDSCFLFLLVMFDNFIAEIFPKELFKFFKENNYAKQFLFYILIYFALVLDSDHQNSLESNLTMALVVYLAYLSFSKTKLYISLLTIGLLVVNLFIDTVIRHYEKENIEHQRLTAASNYIYYAIIIVLFFSIFLHFHAVGIKYLNKNILTTKILSI